MARKKKLIKAVKDRTPGTELIFILESKSPKPTPEEQRILDDITSSPGIYHKPRTIKTTVITTDNFQPWQNFGFPDYESYAHWLSFNNCIHAELTEYYY
ncbi:hypothetical protein [Klebsiella aerogenes]|uniref:hypothetical protein n=1 Tax=Klebsiella aerogenes TaxID=548 RepID=UPI0010391C97|nr:hypothetical protein [Klebsiella aerogenes]